MKKALKIRPESKSKASPTPKMMVKPKVEVQANARLIERWRPEIQELMQEEFASVEEACSALIDKVAEKMSQSTHVRAEMKQFLVDVFAMDPTLTEALREILTIKEK